MALDQAKRMQDIYEDNKRLRAAFLGYLQTENQCARTGQPCRTGGTCGCALEMQGYVLAHEQDANK